MMITYCRLTEVQITEKKAQFLSEDGTPFVVQLETQALAEDMSIALAVSDEPIYYCVNMARQELVEGDTADELFN